MERKRAMIVFDVGSWRFNYRVGAIIIRDGHVLLMRMGANDFWFVPGGRVEAGETARLALEREITEELGVTGEVGRLLWANENESGPLPRTRPLFSGDAFQGCPQRSVGEVHRQRSGWHSIRVCLAFAGIIRQDPPGPAVPGQLPPQIAARSRAYSGS